MNGRKLTQIIGSLARDVILLAGLAMLVYGTAQFSVPAAWMITGVMAIVGATLMSLAMRGGSDDTGAKGGS